MAGETYSIVVNGTKSYQVRTDNVTNPLSAGPYHVTADVRIISGFDPATHTLAIVTDADDVRALRMVYAAGGFAIWQIYDAQEAFAGYLTISVTATGVLCEVTSGTPTGAWSIGEAATTEEIFLSDALNWLKSDEAASVFTDPDQISSAVTTAKAKAVPAEE